MYACTDSQYFWGLRCIHLKKPWLIYDTQYKNFKEQLHKKNKSYTQRKSIETRLSINKYVVHLFYLFFFFDFLFFATAVKTHILYNLSYGDTTKVIHLGNMTESNRTMVVSIVLHLMTKQFRGKACYLILRCSREGLAD